MATQLYPKTKDSNVSLLGATKKNAADTDVAKWIDNNSYSVDGEYVVTTKTKAVDTGLLSNMLFTMDDFVKLFYTSPSAPSVTQASVKTNNTLSKHSYLVSSTASSLSVDCEVGTKIATTEALFTIKSKTAKGDNGNISSVKYNGNTITLTGASATIGSAKITATSRGTSGSYTADATVLPGADNTGSATLSNSVLIGDGTVDLTGTIKPAKDLYVVPDSNTTGRVKFTLNTTDSIGSEVNYEASTKTGSGDTIITGTNGTKTISGSTLSSAVAAKKLTLTKPVTTDLEYSIGVGYRKFFCGVLDSYTTSTVALNALKDNGARTATTMYFNTKVTTGSNHTSNYPVSITDKYIYFAVPHGNTVSNAYFLDKAGGKIAFNVYKISPIAGTNINGANSQYPTPYDIYISGNSKEIAALTGSNLDLYCTIG